MSVLDKKVVLVLNRNWQAVNVATGLDVHGADSMVPVSWERWLDLAVREGDFSVGTAGGRIRVPTVMVLGRFSRVPMVRPKFSFPNLWVRDGGRCEYTGRTLGAGEGNVDHVVPRMLPVTVTLKNEHRIAEWELFLSGMSPG